MNDDGTLWQLAALAKPERVDFPDGTVVYHAGSGDSHLMAPWAADVLSLLGAGAGSVGTLADGLVERHPGTDREMWVERLPEAMQDLTKAGFLATFSRRDRRDD